MEHGLTLVSGSLEIARSSSRRGRLIMPLLAIIRLAMCDACIPGGGGIYIHQGDLRQEGGRTKLHHCRSEGWGGGLRIRNGQLHQHAGNISCQSCTARLHGGCVAINVNGGEGLGMNSRGSIKAQSCTAESGWAVVFRLRKESFTQAIPTCIIFTIWQS